LSRLCTGRLLSPLIIYSSTVALPMIFSFSVAVRRENQCYFSCFSNNSFELVHQNFGSFIYRKLMILLQIYDVVRYRLHRMKHKLKDELENKNSIQEYICTNCGKRFQ
jgi:hypothetical protein